MACRTSPSGLVAIDMSWPRWVGRHQSRAASDLSRKALLEQPQECGNQGNSAGLQISHPFHPFSPVGMWVGACVCACACIRACVCVRAC
eukprot:14936396-Alexandrium_andersonii.AAC.1